MILIYYYITIYGQYIVEYGNNTINVKGFFKLSVIYGDIGL